MSGVGRFIRKRRAKRAAFMADPAINNLFLPGRGEASLPLPGPTPPRALLGVRIQTLLSFMRIRCGA